MVFNATCNNISTEHIKIMVKRFTDFAHNVPISIKIHIEKEQKTKSKQYVVHLHGYFE